jgi:hypothetical protein
MPEGATGFDTSMLRAELRGLDDLISEDSVGVVKIGVEGHEFEVRKGPKSFSKIGNYEILFLKVEIFIPML